MHCLPHTLAAAFLTLAAPLSAQRIAPAAWAAADSLVVRLRPRAFAGLPAAVRKDLEHRGCLIPQSPEARGLHNVERGHLKDSVHVDWVVLCSINHVSRVLVYWSGETSAVDSLPATSDRSYLQGMGGSTIAFSHVISVVDSRYIREHAENCGGPLPTSPIHDGIDDAFAGKASTVRYWQAGAWIDLAGAD